MKVVLFCGGAGMRLRDYADHIPKPLVNVGQRPILWHLMKYYSHWGHKEFILCLGYGAHKIKEFFLKYDEWATNDFVLSHGGRNVQLLGTDIDEWNITFVDTGHESNVGERLRHVEPYLEGDDVFLANYADGLSDLPLDTYVESFLKDKVASFVTVPIQHTYHLVHTNGGGDVTGSSPSSTSSLRINGGFFVLRSEIFQYMQPNEELVFEPFDRLIGEQRLLAYPYDGFWRAMDTFKDKVELDRIVAADGLLGSCGAATCAHPA